MRWIWTRPFFRGSTPWGAEVRAQHGVNPWQHPLSPSLGRCRASAGSVGQISNLPSDCAQQGMA
jgi:hypothetical protein